MSVLFYTSIKSQVASINQLWFLYYLINDFTFTELHTLLLSILFIRFTTTSLPMPMPRLSRIRYDGIVYILQNSITSARTASILDY